MAFWTDRPVFVTGATGLLGSHMVAELLDRGANAVCLVRDQVSQSHFQRLGLDRRAVIVRGSLEDYPLLERALNEHEIDTVLHLGAQTIVGTANRNPLATFEANIRGTYNLLEAARRNGKKVKRVVVASSDKAYGAQPVLPYDEDAPLTGRFPYDCSKSCTDLIARCYFETYRLNVCITRCGNLFGPGDLNWNRIVPGTIRSAIRGERPIIRSDGHFIRDYVYVGDAVAAYLDLAEQMHRPEVAGGVELDVAGGVAGMMALVGGAMLLHRRLFDPRIRANSTLADTGIMVLLMAQLLLGLATITVSFRNLDGAEMVKFMNWAQGIFTFRSGAADQIADVALVFKLHLFMGLTILLLFPFTRLVHMLSAPVRYVWRPGYQVVRSRKLAR